MKKLIFVIIAVIALSSCGRLKKANVDEKLNDSTAVELVDSLKVVQDTTLVK